MLVNKMSIYLIYVLFITSAHTNETDNTKAMINIIKILWPTIIARLSIFLSSFSKDGVCTGLVV